MKKPAIAKEMEVMEAVEERRRLLVARRKELLWFWTRREFSLELIATTAARMPGLAISYSHAADEALQLLDACARIQERSRVLTETANSIARDAAALGISLATKTVPYLQAIKIITSQQRPERAQADFDGFLRANIDRGDGTNGAALTPLQRQALIDLIAMYKTNGFPPEEVVFRWQSFQQARKLGHLKKKHKTKKISLPQKSTSKADKNSKVPVRIAKPAARMRKSLAKNSESPAKN